MTNYFEHIEDYLNDNLSAESKEAFDSEMIKNKELQKAVDNYGIASAALELILEDDIRSIIDEVELSDTENSSVVPLSPSRNKIYFRIAASLLFLAIAYFSFNFYVKEQFSHQAVLNEYYIPPANPNATRSDSFEGPPIEEAMYLFDLRRFDESRTKFEEVLSTQNTPQQGDLIQFYLGNIAYIKNDISRAKAHFSKSNDPRKHEFMAQIHYLEGDIPSLERLNDSHPSNKIQELLTNTQDWKYKWAK